MNRRDLASRLDRLASDIGRLRPNWANPSHFFEQRDELRRAAQSIRKQLEKF